MKTTMKLGEFVKIPDGRIGVLIERFADTYTVRVRRQTGIYHQFLYFTMSELKAVPQSKKTNNLFARDNRNSWKAAEAPDPIPRVNYKNNRDEGLESDKEEMALEMYQ